MDVSEIELVTQRVPKVIVTFPYSTHTFHAKILCIS